MLNDIIGSCSARFHFSDTRFRIPNILLERGCSSSLDMRSRRGYGGEPDGKRNSRRIPSCGVWERYFCFFWPKLFNLRLVSEACMRALAKSGHWYDHRQHVQFAVAIALPFVCAVLTSIFFATKGRAFFRRHGSALWGWVMLLLYLTLRQTQEWKPVLPWLAAISYRDWRLVLEAGGIGLVAFSAFALRNEERVRDAGS